MRDSVVVRLSLLLIATAIFVLGSSVIVSAGKKCISIGEKQVCFDDGKNKKKKNDAGGTDAGNGNAPAEDNAAPNNATPDNAAPQNTGNKCQGRSDLLRSLPAGHHRRAAQMLLSCRTGLGCRSQRLQRATEMPRRHDRHTTQL
jgi:hypothetical protein